MIAQKIDSDKINSFFMHHRTHRLTDFFLSWGQLVGVGRSTLIEVIQLFALGMNAKYRPHNLIFSEQHPNVAFGGLGHIGLDDDTTTTLFGLTLHNLIEIASIGHQELDPLTIGFNTKRPGWSFANRLKSRSWLATSVGGVKAGNSSAASFSFQSRRACGRFTTLVFGPQ